MRTPHLFEAQAYQHVYPPSTRTTLPVIRLAASDARNRTTDAISSTSPIRAIGVPPIQASYICGLFLTNALRGVAIYVGATALTRTPRAPHSAASDLVKWCTAAFEAL